jgi:hypothetical protein
MQVQGIKAAPVWVSAREDLNFSPWRNSLEPTNYGVAGASGPDGGAWGFGMRNV